MPRLSSASLSRRSVRSIGVSRRHTEPVPLDEYRRKRDRGRTPEPIPAGEQPAEGPGEVFVIQQHHARALHWDLRLERDGVLASASRSGPRTIRWSTRSSPGTSRPASTAPAT
jgi:hypothetical protein